MFSWNASGGIDRQPGAAAIPGFNPVRRYQPPDFARCVERSFRGRFARDADCRTFGRCAEIRFNASGLKSTSPQFGHSSTSISRATYGVPPRRLAMSRMTCRIRLEPHTGQVFRAIAFIVRASMRSRDNTTPAHHQFQGHPLPARLAPCSSAAAGWATRIF